MSLINWSPNLSVGVDFMDEEHATLMERINALHDLVGSGRREKVLQALERLTQSASAHFAAEEQVMRSNDYSGYEHHSRVHAALLEELEQFREALADEQTVLTPQLTEFLKTWLIGHIMESDKHLGGFIEGIKRAGRDGG